MCKFIANFFILGYIFVVIHFTTVRITLDHLAVTNNLDFLPECPKAAYNMQLKAMAEYIAVLEVRAAIEHISI